MKYLQISLKIVVILLAIVGGVTLSALLWGLTNQDRIPQVDPQKKANWVSPEFQGIVTALNEEKYKELYELSSFWFRKHVSYTVFVETLEKEKIKVSRFKKITSHDYGGSVAISANIHTTNKDGPKTAQMVLVYFDRDGGKLRFNNLPIGGTLSHWGPFGSPEFLRMGFTNYEMKK